MAQRNQDMSKVGAYGDLIPEGCYHWRLDSVKDDGGNEVFFNLKCQTEPFVGRGVRDRFEMDNSTALAKLKAYYKAAGYEAPDGQHDPEAVSGMEFTAVVKHNSSKGNTYANIAPWSIRSLQEAPVQELGPES